MRKCKCGNMVARNAKACPKCGHRPSSLSAVVVVGIVLGIMMVFAMFTVQTTPQPELSPAQQVAKAKNEAIFQRAVAGAKQLRSSMRNPDSFKLSDSIVMADGAVCYTYRAQNGFGGLNVGNAVLAPNGKFKSSDSPGYATMWNKECGGKTGTDDADIVNVALNMQK
jgi:hypothetical protein